MQFKIQLLPTPQKKSMVGHHATKYQRRDLLGKTHLDPINSQSRSLGSQDRAGQPRLETLESTLSEGPLLPGLDSHSPLCLHQKERRAGSAAGSYTSLHPTRPPPPGWAQD